MTIQRFRSGRNSLPTGYAAAVFYASSLQKCTGKQFHRIYSSLVAKGLPIPPTLPGKIGVSEKWSPSHEIPNANLAATNTFGLPNCTSPTTLATCVNQDGAMTWPSASQFVTNMNSDNGTGYLGQSHSVHSLQWNCGPNQRRHSETRYGGRLHLWHHTELRAADNQITID